MNRTNLKVRHILDDIPTKEEFQEVIEKVKLTPRQLEILELRFIRHLLNYEIADRLGLSEKNCSTGSAKKLPDDPRNTE